MMRWCCGGPGSTVWQFRRPLLGVLLGLLRWWGWVLWLLRLRWLLWLRLRLRRLGMLLSELDLVRARCLLALSVHYGCLPTYQLLQQRLEASWPAGAALMLVVATSAPAW